MLTDKQKKLCIAGSIILIIIIIITVILIYLNNSKENYQQTAIIPKIAGSYVLNLDKDTDRLKKTMMYAERAGLKPIRIPGIYGKDLGTKDDLIQKNILDKNVNIPNGVGDSLNWVACFIGIQKMIEHVAAMPDNSCGLIMEDDVFFVKDFKQKLPKLLKKIPNDWDIIHLGLSEYCLEIHQPFNKEGETKYVKFIKKFDKNHKIYKWQNIDDYFYDKYFIGGNFGVLLRPQAAKLWLKSARPIKHAADVHFNYIIQKHNLNAYFVHNLFINYFRESTNINSDENFSEGSKNREKIRLEKEKKFFDI